MQAVILAAGKGERLRPLTDTVPKVMLRVANKPILEYNLENLRGVAEEVILVVGYRSEKIKEHFGEEFRGMKIKYAEQREQLGTGHALSQAEPLIKGRFMLLMGDNFYSVKDIRRCAERPCSILVKTVDNPEIFGVCSVKNGLLTGILEKPKNPPSNLVNAALYVLDRSIFDTETRKSKRGEYEITDSVNGFVKEKDVHVIEADDYDYITYPWDILRVNEKMLKRNGSSIDKGAKIGKECRIEGPVAIGRGAVLKNCIVRGYTSIGEGAVIGNFVEIKNSVIGKNTKIPHLSYVGDSVIGSGCNFGAGTKVANLRFDDGNVKVLVRGKPVDSGRRKLGCIMGDDVKTAINTSIMPGQSIDSNSLIVAGNSSK